MTVKKKQTKSKGKRKSRPKSPEEQMKAYYKMKRGESSILITENTLSKANTFYTTFIKLRIFHKLLEFKARDLGRRNQVRKCHNRIRSQSL